MSVDPSENHNLFIYGENIEEGESEPIIIEPTEDETNFVNEEPELPVGNSAQKTLIDMYHMLMRE